DPDRREGRAALFLGMAVLAVAAIVGVRLFWGSFLCLLLVDYLWNGWHFASQHQGVLAIYGRTTGGAGTPWPDRWGVRLFVCYVIARTAEWAVGWLEEYPGATAALRWADLAVLVVPATLLVRAFLNRPWERLPRTVYLASGCGLYAALFLALREHATTLVLALTTAGALFDATECVAVVTHYAWRRRATGSGGLFRVMAGRWVLVLGAYLLLWGLSAVVLESWGGEVWRGLNLWAAFLHYAYDGMIW